MNRKDLLGEAIEATRSRGENYGTPLDNFNNIAALWSAYKEVPFTAKDVGMMMTLLKIARLKHSDHDDSFVDIAGYAAVTCEAVAGIADTLHLQAGQQNIAPMKQG
jgi:hypothetical protein